MSTTLEDVSRLEPSQVRMARSGLNLTVRELAVLAEVNKATIVRIEAGYPVRETTLSNVRIALEKQGAQFLMCGVSRTVLVGLSLS